MFVVVAAFHCATIFFVWQEMFVVLAFVTGVSTVFALNSSVADTSLAFSKYCPSSSDIKAAYGSPSIYDRGWSITAGADGSLLCFAPYKVFK